MSIERHHVWRAMFILAIIEWILLIWWLGPYIVEVID